MRNVLFLSATLSSLMMMNAYSAPLDNATPQTTAPTANVTPTSSTDPRLQANLSLKQDGQRLYARVLIEQAQNTNGKVRIDWTPPMHSSCDKSSYFLSYQGTKFHTQAYRTLGYGLISGKSITCTGTWQATVINEQGQTIATAKITIEAVDSYANNTAAKMHSLAAIA